VMSSGWQHRSFISLQWPFHVLINLYSSEVVFATAMIPRARRVSRKVGEIGPSESMYHILESSANKQKFGTAYASK